LTRKSSSLRVTKWKSALLIPFFRREAEDDLAL